MTRSHQNEPESHDSDYFERSMDSLEVPPAIVVEQQQEQASTTDPPDPAAWGDFEE